MLRYPGVVDASVKVSDEHDSLVLIIERINEHFPEDFTEGDRVLVETMHRTSRKIVDAKSVNTARNNSVEMLENNLFKEQFQDFILKQ